MFSSKQIKVGLNIDHSPKCWPLGQYCRALQSAVRSVSRIFEDADKLVQSCTRIVGNLEPVYRRLSTINLLKAPKST